MKRLLLALALIGSAAAADTWTFDTRHSGVTFAVRNFFVPVEGSLKLQSGKIVFDAANPAASSVEAVIAVTTINTQDTDRDKHLNNQDFFLTEKFPTAAFKSTKWESAGDNKFKVTGDLTIKDMTRTVTLDVALLGTGTGNRGRTISGWQATTRLNRKDFGVAYGASIADEVAITINVQGMKEEAPKQN
jgi:polyisoprenoid-binding protein YceI